MGSGFTFRGLGEPIQQLRELLKDVCYRNRQEKAKGEIELLRLRIDVLRDIRRSTEAQVILTGTINGVDLREAVQLLLEHEISGSGDAPTARAENAIPADSVEEEKPKRKSRPKRKPR